MAAMDHLLDAIKQTPMTNTASPSAVFDMVRQWKGTGENLLKSLVDYVSDIESRENEIRSVGESIERRSKDLEERERCLNRMSDDSKNSSNAVELREKELDEQLKSVREHIEGLEAAQSEVHGLKLEECEKLKAIEKREREVDAIAWSLEKRLREVDQREKELDLKEGVMRRKREEFGEEVRLANERLRERDKLGGRVLEMLDSAMIMLEGKKFLIDDKFKEIKSWKTTAHKSLIASLSEADLVRDSLEKRFRECEEMEREFNMLQEDEMKKLESKERQLSIKRGEFLKEIDLRDERLTERFKEVESWETVAHRSLTLSLSEADSIREALDKKFKEFEEMEKELNSIQEDKMQKLESKERELRATRTELLKDVKLRDEKSAEINKIGHQVMTSLEELLATKLKEIESRELSVNEASEKVAASAKDADLIRESANIRSQELEKRAKEFQLFCGRKTIELMLEEEKLRLTGKEIIKEVMYREEKFDLLDKMMHGLLERLESAQNNVKDMNTLVSKRFKEIEVKEVELNHTRVWVEKKKYELFKEKKMKEQVKGVKLEEGIAMSEEKELKGKKKEFEFKEGSLVDQPEKLVENHAGYLSEKDQQPECSQTEIESKGKQNRVLKECEFKQPKLNDALGACSGVEPDHLKTLETLINYTEKDLELIGDDVFKVLFLSSDPAKLVINAVEGFYICHLGKGDIGVNVRRKCILLLDQLTKTSPSIQPCVRKAAIKLAYEWKSKMSLAENSLEVLGFLHFVAAYNLSSCFGKVQLLSLLKKVAQHKQTPELCRILGLSEEIPGFIQNLIKEKQYLVASTYIHECGLENTFPQTAVLNYYVQHSKAKHRRERTTPEAQEKAIASEIADLCVAIEHITKYGLEYEFSPNSLTARIKQLEKNRAGLKIGTRLSTDVKRQEKIKRSALRRQDAIIRKAQEKQHDSAKVLLEVPVARPSKRHKTNTHEGVIKSPHKRPRLRR